MAYVAGYVCATVEPMDMLCYAMLCMVNYSLCLQSTSHIIQSKLELCSYAGKLVMCIQSGFPQTLNFEQPEII